MSQIDNLERWADGNLMDKSNTDFEAVVKNTLLNHHREPTLEDVQKVWSKEPTSILDTAGATKAILLAHNQTLEAAVRAAVLQELADLKFLEDLRGSELPHGTIADRIAELRVLPTPDSGTAETPKPESFGNVSGKPNAKKKYFTREELRQNIGFLRQWLNEGRITDKPMVTNEQLERWIFDFASGERTGEDKS